MFFFCFFGHYPWLRGVPQKRWCSGAGTEPSCNSWGESAAWLRLTADCNIIDDLIEKQEEAEEVDERRWAGGGHREEGERRAPMRKKFTCSSSAQSHSWGHWCERRGFLFFTRTSFPPSLTLTHGAQIHLLTFSLARLCFFSFLFLPFMNDSLSQYSC